MVFLAVIEGKYFCGLCGSLLPGEAKKCPVCLSELEEKLECVFCEQCSSITPIGVEMCQICGAKQKPKTIIKDGAPRVNEPLTEPPPIPSVHEASIKTPQKETDSLHVSAEKEASINPPSEPKVEPELKSKPASSMVSAPLLEAQAELPRKDAEMHFVGSISENEKDPAKLHAYIKELQEEIALLRMSIDDQEIQKKTSPPTSSPPKPPVNQQAIEKLNAMNKSLTTLLEKMKKYESTAIFKIITNFQKDVEELLRLLKE